MRADGNLPDSLKDTKLSPHIDSAVIEVKRLLGYDEYDIIASYEDSEDPDELKQFTECQKAETLIALSIAIPILNIETAGSGIVLNKGWGDNRSELLSPGQAKDLAADFRARAMSLLGPYLPAFTGDEEDEDDDDDVFDLGASGRFTAV